MRQVCSSQEVAKRWADGTTWTARNQHSSLYYRDSVIYSYGAHFPIAVKYQGVVLFTTRRWSVTTSKHTSIVARVISGERVIYCENVLARTVPDHLANLAAMRERYDKFLTQARTARSRQGHYLAQAQHEVENHGAYREVFGLSKVFSAGLDTPFERVIYCLVEDGAGEREVQ